jgi:DNA-binding HxlR family transcriptional regulator
MVLELNEKERKILKECIIPRKNQWLKENLVKNPTWLSHYLKDLQIHGYLKRGIEGREYQTIPEGKAFLDAYTDFEQRVNEIHG